METNDGMTKEQRGIKAERYDNGNLNIVTNCGIGRLVVGACAVNGIGSFVFFETKEPGSLTGKRDPGEDGWTGVSHELQFHSIESLDNIINPMTGFRDKWKADQ